MIVTTFSVNENRYLAGHYACQVNLGPGYSIVGGLVILQLTVGSVDFCRNDVYYPAF